MDPSAPHSRREDGPGDRSFVPLRPVKILEPSNDDPTRWEPAWYLPMFETREAAEAHANGARVLELEPIPEDEEI